MRMIRTLFYNDYKRHMCQIKIIIQYFEIENFLYKYSLFLKL